MIKYELKNNIKTCLIWLFFMVVMFVFVYLIYPSIVSETNLSAMNEMIKTMPKEMIKTFNMDIVTIDSVFGWIKTEGYTFILLISGIFSALLGFNCLVKEENDKTIEFLYSKPINKSKILNEKVIASLIAIIVFNLLFMIFNFIALTISDDMHYKMFFLLFTAPLFIDFIIYFACLFFSTFFRNTRLTTSLAIVFVFIMYFLQIIGSLSEDFEFIKNCSIFELFSSREILLDETFKISSVFISIGLIIVFYILSLINYKRKEFL